MATRAYPDVGGIESHLDNLVPRLQTGEWELDLVVTDVTGQLPRTAERHGSALKRHRAFPASRDWYLSPGLFWDIARGRRDLVHIHGINALVPPVAMLAALVGRTPFVLTLHSGGANTSLRSRMRATQWQTLAPLLRRAAAVIAVSDSEARTFAQVLGHGPIPVIPNGAFEVTAPDVVSDPDLVLSVGRLERYKGHHRVIEALPLLRKTRPNVRLRILGTGPYEPDLIARATALGVADQVVVTAVPPQDRDAMAHEMAAAGAVALLSDYEAHPVVVLEAMSLGRPVVARYNSGMATYVARGLVDGVPDACTVDEVAAALEVALGRRNRPVPTLPTWDDCADGVAEIYREVLGTSVRART